jgi:organic hydroperoxide reductase OsmC/OhrA
MHTFPLSLAWRGDTASPDYPRDATVGAPGKVDLATSAGIAAMGGDLSKWNPEDLLGAALATCHLLTFLALAAKRGLPVRAVDGGGEVVLDRVDQETQVTEIRLTPTITLGPGGDAALAEELFGRAHRYCYIARSLRGRVVTAPTVVVSG